VWLDLATCENIYNTFRTEFKLNGDEPLPEFKHRYPGKLESILESIKLRYGQMETAASVGQIAASYFTHITKSQALVNGNKRMGVLFTTVFLSLNNLELELSQQRVTDLSLLVATSKAKLPKVVELITPVFEDTIKQQSASFRETVTKIVRDYVARLPNIKFPSWQRK